MPPQGPRRRAWERTAHELDRLRQDIVQLRTDLDSYNYTHGAKIEMSLPSVLDLPRLPPMPAWEE